MFGKSLMKQIPDTVLVTLTVLPLMYFPLLIIVYSFRKPQKYWVLPQEHENASKDGKLHFVYQLLKK